MTITAGKVGIATASPGGLLSVYAGNQTSHANAASGILIGNGTGANCVGQVGFGPNGGTNPAAYYGYLQTDGGGNTNGALILSTRSGTGDDLPTERMRVGSTGDVYIGTDNEGLSINGNTGGAGTITGINKALSAYKKLVFNATEYSWKISGSEKMSMNTNGELGVGVAPSASGVHIYTDKAQSANLSAMSGHQLVLQTGSDTNDTASMGFYASGDGYVGACLTFERTGNAGTGDLSIKVKNSGNQSSGDEPSSVATFNKDGNAVFPGSVVGGVFYTEHQSCSSSETMSFNVGNGEMGIWMAQSSAGNNASMYWGVYFSVSGNSNVISSQVSSHANGNNTGIGITVGTTDTTLTFTTSSGASGSAKIISMGW